MDEPMKLGEAAWSRRRQWELALRRRCDGHIRCRWVSWLRAAFTLVWTPL